MSDGIPPLRMEANDPGKLTARPEGMGDLAALLRSKRLSLQQVGSGLSKVLTLEPLTSVKDLIIVGEGPAAEDLPVLSGPDRARLPVPRPVQ